jgi:hypothetical protein
MWLSVTHEIGAPGWPLIRAAVVPALRTRTLEIVTL